MPLDRLYLSPQCGFASCDIGNKLTEEEQWAKLKLVKEVAEEVWQDANTSFAGKSTRYSIFFDDKIHLLVGETNKGLNWNPRFQFAKVNPCSGYFLQE